MTETVVKDDGMATDVVKLRDRWVAGWRAEPSRIGPLSGNVISDATALRGDHLVNARARSTNSPLRLRGSKTIDV